MRRDWILDVLADLKTFAQSNGLPDLAEHLDDAALVAMAEIATREERVKALAHGTYGKPQDHTGDLGSS